MQKWEYHVYTCGTTGDIPIENQIRSLGEDGWELVSATESYGVYTLFFKRLRS